MFLGASFLDVTTVLGVGRLNLATAPAMVAAASVACGILSSELLVLKKWCLIHYSHASEKITTGTRVVENTLSLWKPKIRHSRVLEAP